MRIISMVPSWTETLIEAEADLVGRTRFCIHPGDKIRAIPAVGGTKQWDVEKIRKLKPDLIVLDQEENTREMGQFDEFPLVTTHVKGLEDMPGELKKLAKATGLKKMHEYAERFEFALKGSYQLSSLEDLPGVEEWIHPLAKDQKIDRVVYVIWKNPWMAVSSQTFIGSMLERFVGRQKVWRDDNSYPPISFESFDEESTLLLFSTEPFPFAKQKAELQKLGFASAIVDGEKWSWFGIRSLRFLESFRKV